MNTDIEELEYLSTQGVMRDGRGRCVARTLARLKGEKHFYTGHPCGNGHTANRNTKSGNCQGCVNSSNRRSRLRNKSRPAT